MPLATHAFVEATEAVKHASMAAILRFHSKNADFAIHIVHYALGRQIIIAVNVILGIFSWVTHVLLSVHQGTTVITIGGNAGSAMLVARFATGQARSCV